MKSLIKKLAEKRIKSLEAKKKKIVTHPSELEVEIEFWIQEPSLRLHIPEREFHEEKIVNMAIEEVKRKGTQTITDTSFGIPLEVPLENLSKRDAIRYRRLDGKQAFWERFV